MMDEPVGYDRQLWIQMSDQLGLHGLAIDEAYGGSGFGLVELGIVFEEMGRALLPGPFFASVGLAAAAISTSADREACLRYLPAIASGESIATLAVTEERGKWGADDIQTVGVLQDGGWQLSGSKCFVLDAAGADLILVVARTEAGLSLFAVDADATGVSITPKPVLDLTRRQARVDLTAAPATLVGIDGAAWTGIQAAMDIASTLLAAEAVGGAERAIELAVEYAKVREQFGRPIGSFQAIKHKCATMLVDVEAARSAAYYALWAGSVQAGDFTVAASLAKSFCGDAYYRVAAENIQIHGGIGFTWEHPAHLYYKRAKSMQLYLGDSQFHRAQLADRAGF